MTNPHIHQAALFLQQGGVIAYPTEAVYGLGCDPYQPEAVARLLQLKHRATSKGLIIIGSDWTQLAPLVAELPHERMEAIFQTWPGPITWVFPLSKLAPEWLYGAHSSLAVRITNHPIAKALCQKFAKPIVSTSANVEGGIPARNSATVKQIFADSLDYIIPGEVGGLAKPTEIRDAVTGKVLRAATM